MTSLRDQLLKAGLTDKQSVKLVRKQKQKKHKQTGKSNQSQSAIQVSQAQQQKAVRDKELNRQRQRHAEQKAQLAQVKQLVDINKVDRIEGQVAYHFTDDNKVKKIYVTLEQQIQLVDGQLSIIKLAVDQYELVAKPVADKIAKRASVCIVDIKQQQPDLNTQDDPYADYQVPDDLVW